MGDDDPSLPLRSCVPAAAFQLRTHSLGGRPALASRRQQDFPWPLRNDEKRGSRLLRLGALAVLKEYLEGALAWVGVGSVDTEE